MAAAPKPSIRFTHTKALRNKTLRILDAIDTEADPTPYREDLADNINELAEVGLRYFFLQPVAKLKMGFVVEQTANVGVHGSQRIMGPAIRNIVGRMNKKQLRQVSKIMRQMMD